MVLRIKAARREDTGKNANRRLRREGYVPANLVLPDENESIPIKTKLGEVRRLLSEHAQLIELELEGEEVRPAFLKGIEWDNIKDSVLHVDLVEARMDRPINAVVPINFKGTPAGVVKGGVFTILISDVEVTGLPMDIPPEITVNVADLEIGDALTLADVEIPEKITLRTRTDLRICEIHLPSRAQVEEAEEVEAPEAEEAEAPEAEEKKEEESKE